MIRPAGPSPLSLLVTLLALCVVGGLLALPGPTVHAQSRSTESALVSLSTDSSSTTEVESVVVPLTRTESADQAQTVRVYSTEPNHPEETSDSNPSSRYHTVTFDAGSDTATLSVPVGDDGMIESNDWISIQLSPPPGSDYRPGSPYQLAVIITDPVITVTVSADQERVAERAAAVFTLSRSGSTVGALSANVSVSDPGGVQRGDCWNPTPNPQRTVAFAAGSETATLSLQTQDDS